MFHTTLHVLRELNYTLASQTETQTTCYSPLSYYSNTWKKNINISISKRLYQCIIISNLRVGVYDT